MGPEDWGVVLGGAETLWDDLSRLEEIIGGTWPGVVIAVNDAGVDYPHRVDHWVSYHPEKFLRVCPPGDTGEWEARREAAGRNTDYLLWSHRAKHIVDRIIPRHGGSSGQLAVEVGLDHLGLRRVVLCGVPMERRPHYHDAHDGKPWTGARHHWPWEDEFVDRWRQDLRSMSGNTRSTFGAPTLPWLRGTEE